MTPADAAPIWLLIAAAGVLLVRRGYFPRRTGRTVHCPRCDYDVRRIGPMWCPECGNDLLVTGVTRGDRRPNRALGRLGVVLILLPLGIGARESYRRVDWYSYRPAGTVIRDLDSTNAATAGRAWRELQRRGDVNDLSPAAEASIADLELAALGRVPPHPLLAKLEDDLWRRWKRGALSPAQADRLFGSYLVVNWSFRPKVLVGQDLPYRIAVTDKLPPEYFWHIDLIPAGGEEPVASLDWLEFKLNPVSAGIVTGSASPTAGPRVLDLTERLSVYANAVGAGPTPLWSAQRPRRVDVRVLAAAEKGLPPEFVAVVPNPDLADDVKSSCHVPGVSRYGGMLMLTVRSFGPPVNLAMDVLARGDGREVCIGTVAWAAGERGERNLAAPAPGLPAQVDIILRTNAAAAAATVDVSEVWGGEVVFPDIRIIEKVAADFQARPK
jgi:hypothetical protein